MRIDADTIILDSKSDIVGEGAPHSHGIYIKRRREPEGGLPYKKNTQLKIKSVD